MTTLLKQLEHPNVERFFNSANRRLVRSIHHYQEMLEKPSQVLIDMIKDVVYADWSWYMSDSTLTLRHGEERIDKLLDKVVRFVEEYPEHKEVVEYCNLPLDDKTDDAIYRLWPWWHGAMYYERKHTNPDCVSPVHIRMLQVGVGMDVWAALNILMDQMSVVVAEMDEVYNNTLLENHKVRFVENIYFLKRNTSHIRCISTPQSLYCHTTELGDHCARIYDELRLKVFLPEDFQFNRKDTETDDVLRFSKLRTGHQCLLLANYRDRRLKKEFHFIVDII